MNKTEFRSEFGKVAKAYGFKAAHGGWFRQSDECITVLVLQKSNFENRFMLNLKVFVQGAFGRTHSISKELVKNDVGNVFTRTPASYDDVFDFERPEEYVNRLDRIRDLFKEFISPFTDQSLSREGIFALAAEKRILLLPAVQEELRKLA